MTIIFYFFLIRPQQKKVKEHKSMVAALKRGDEVVTSGGIVGKVERVLGDDKVDLSITENRLFANRKRMDRIELLPGQKFDLAFWLRTQFCMHLDSDFDTFVKY